MCALLAVRICELRCIQESKCQMLISLIHALKAPQLLYQQTLHAFALNKQDRAANEQQPRTCCERTHTVPLPQRNGLRCSCEALRGSSRLPAEVV